MNRLSVYVGGLGLAWWVLVAVAGCGQMAAATEPVAISDSSGYFPDTQGSWWRYRGQSIEGPLQTIATKNFVNVSTVKGTQAIKGVTVKAFHDTNPGGHEPSDSFYRRDAAGIIYYGSTPGSPLEKQLAPYQIVRFPLQIPSSFQQFDRKDLKYGTDVDGDEKDEKVDVEASVAVVGRETVQVPAGTYRDTVRLESRMTMRIHLSRERQTVIGTDVMNVWFARGVGVVKYVERQEFPSIKGDRGMVTETTEELEEAEIKPE
jgi:hypothetical protein